MFCEYDTLSRKNPALFRKSSDSRFLCNSARHSVCPLQILYWSALVWNSEVCDTIGSSLRLWLKRPTPPRLARGSPLFKSSTRLVPRGSGPSRPSSAGRSASASLSARKICPAYFFDRNRTSKKLRQLPKPRLCCGSQNKLTNRLT